MCVEDEWKVIQLLDNSSLQVNALGLEKMPDYIEERIALLRMCDVNKQAEGESIGRKISDNQILVYLNYDEYKELLKFKI